MNRKGQGYNYREKICKMFKTHIVSKAMDDARSLEECGPNIVSGDYGGK